MKKVVIRGPVMTQSGYGVHSRQFVKYAMKKTDWDVAFQVTPWGITPWQINTNDPVIKYITERTSHATGPFDLSIQVQLPNEWDPDLARRNIGVSAIVETTRCNSSWVGDCNRMDAVIFPSSFTKKVVDDTGALLTKCYVINEAFPEEFETDDCNIDLDVDTDFNFLVYGQITGDNAETDRKNFFYTVRWLCEEFKDEKNVGIVVKTNAGKNTRIDRQVTDGMLKKLLEYVRKSPYPRVHLLHGNLKTTEVGGLYIHPKIKCLVSATRGEGYGLPILEAAAQGLPVIATNWSGHLDFMQHGNFIKLDYDLVSIPANKVDNHIFIAGTKWANVREDDFKKKVRKFYKSHQVPKDWALALMPTIREKFSQSAVEKEIDKAVQEVLS